MPLPDPRLLANGLPIPSEGYADQPYVVRTEEGAWVCAMTTGAGVEGAPGQHVVSLRSTDHGRTWETPVAVEPAGGPEASYAVLLKARTGRLYCFYNHNTDRVSEVKREDGGVYTRVDSLGHYVFRYSDDHGRSWSQERYDVPVREFACDRENVYGGKLRFFWNVGRPLVRGDEVLLVLHKVGAMGPGFFAQSEGVLIRSDNLLTENDPAKLHWETLPDGDIGLRAPEGGGRIAEEQSLTELSDGTLFCVYRTVAGWPACAYSADGGHTWTAPEFLTYTPGGRRVKHPRAANFVWRCGNGRFLYWFHNHGGRFIQPPPEWLPYEDRNPGWVMAGREVETPEGRRLTWSQPEIALYDDDPWVRISYPDLVEEEGRMWLTETQKHVARVHELAPELLEGLFGQGEEAEVVREGLLGEWQGVLPKTVPMPALPEFSQRDNSVLDMPGLDLRAGFSLEVVFRLENLAPGQALLDSRTPEGQGVALETSERGTIELVLNDGRSEQRWDTDPGAILGGVRHHLVVTVDGGPKIIWFLVDGVLGDGGEARQFGWGRFSPHLRSVNGSDALRLSGAGGGLELVRLYGRALRVSEGVSHHRAWLAGA